MDVDDAIRTRRTHKAYGPEPVDRATLDELFELARWAPNHHLTNPWRFRVLGPGALERLKAAAGEEAAGKLDRAPTLIAVSSAGDDEDRDATAVAAAAGRLGWAAAETDWKRLVERDDVDLVDVCTPGSSHAEISIAALEAGKHVLCEKPLANTVPEARAMAEAAPMIRGAFTKPTTRDSSHQ